MYIMVDLLTVLSIHLNDRTKLEKYKAYWLILVILGSNFATTLQDGINNVFVPENGTAKLQWSLFIGENAGRSSVNVMIKKNDALLCQWVKAHGEVNQCDPGMKLTINPEQVQVPGPTNINVTFSFRNKGRSDDGMYECRFVIDEKWHEMQVYQRHLVSTGNRYST
ncbi:uncharacterized protein LOC106165093 [Lingula anatina]|uniref:Uncharacterized protein LOC106165093 n=1 Tax=Lingula anatina TaxID=7574 RepID=A0A1S3IM83_LINAN|nr:uncharacterized protein LOC106165093 [Lingula anatina]|eukprot:XP_013398639.1 uncharacterized protein LOC106165093 [Lingula anatina]